MPRFTVTALLSFFIATAAHGADGPFAPLLSHLDAQSGDWSENNTEVARVFHQCAATITNDYRSTVLRFLGTDMRRHYWISAYLVEDGYLHGTKPDTDFAMLILCQATKITPRNDDELIDALGVRIRLAVLAQRHGFEALATATKTAAARMERTNKKLQGGARPAMSDEDAKIYESITTLPKEID